MRSNTKERWGGVSIGLHWLVAALILLVQVPVGIIMVRLEPGATQNVLFNTHKNVGLIIFGLSVARLAWRLAHPVPVLPADLPKAQARVARATPVLLYALLFVLPVSGYLYTAHGGFPVPLLMLVDLAPLVPESEARAEIWLAVHLWAQWALYAVAGLHVAAALRHHFVRDDEVLRRMITSR